MAATTVTALTSRHVTISVVEAGKLLGMGRDKSYDLARTGNFPVTVLNIFGKMRVRLFDVESYLDELSNELSNPKVNDRSEAQLASFS